VATTAHLTIDDFERLPQDRTENHELVDGELVPMSGNTLYSNSIRDELMFLLQPVVRERKLGKVVAEQEYDFDGNAHAPDVSFFGPEKKALSDPGKRVQRFVPDLAIEVVFANDTFDSVLRKTHRYRSCGTGEVWIVSPATRQVLVFASSGDRILSGEADLTSDLLPGVRIPVQRLFEI